MLRQPAVAQLVFRIHPYLFYTTSSYIWQVQLYDTVVYCSIFLLYFFESPITALGNFLRRRLLFIFREAEAHQVELYGEVTTKHIS